MFNEVFFFTYIFAGFVGFLAILIVVLLAKYWTSANKKLFASIRNFMICTALLDALYFYIAYSNISAGHYSTSPLLRALDISVFIGQVFFWAGYIREKGEFPLSSKKNIRILFYGFFVLCLIAAIIDYGFLLDDYYLAGTGIKRTAAIAIEIFICVFLTLVTSWHLVRGLTELVQKKIRIIVAAISGLITINGIWNTLLVLGLMTKTIDYETESSIDPTALFIFIINIFTVILVTQEDFTALFNITNQQPDKENDISSYMDIIAQSHSLTQREREVLELAYEGLSNPQIAEELFISAHTVKRHMHNIFEKLDVSTRVELIHLINKEYNE